MSDRLDDMVKFLSGLVALLESGDITPEEAGVRICARYPPRELPKEWVEIAEGVFTLDIEGER